MPLDTLLTMPRTVEMMVVTSALPQAKSARGSSVTYVKGDTLRSVEEYEAFVEEFGDVLQDVLASVADQVRDSLVKIAEQDNDWKQFADMIQVGYEEGELVFYFADDDPERVNAAFNLEYGTGETPPNSLFRKYASKHEQEHKALFTDELGEELFHA